MIKFLSKEQILLIHSMVIDETGGAHGVRNYEAVLSSEGVPKQKVFGKELYPALFSKAGAYLRTILTTRPFVDGNRRTALAVALLFLEYNGYRVTASEKEVKRFSAKVASRDIDAKTTALWFTRNCRKEKVLKK